MMRVVGCIQELVGRPMYTELVEGENGKVKPQDGSTAAAVGIKKLLIDVSDVFCVGLFCYSTLIMVALCNRADHYIFALWFVSSIFFSSPNLSGRRLDIYHTSTHGVALVRI